MTHRDLVNRILLAVSPLGLAWPNNTGAIRVEDRMIRYGLVGSADILLVLAPYGRLISIEAKVGNDQWRKRQRGFAAAVNAAGGRYILARSKDGVGEDAVTHVLNEIGRE